MAIQKSNGGDTAMYELIQLTERNYTFIYGEIRVEASLTLYDARIQQLVLTAWPVQGGSCIERYHLIRKADGY